MLSLKGITKNYYLNKTNVINVLKGVDIEFRENEFVSILGPSGCGKTTLLNIVGGLDTCDSGEIVVDGVSTKNFTASDWDNYRNKKIGFVFQSYNLIPHLSVVRNVEMPLILAGEKKSECRKRAIEALKTVGLEEQVYKKPLQLSGGQMQRVAIARALVTNPDIILADEPTGALDNEASVQVMALLKEVSENRLVIMVTHNNLLADEYSTRIINLNGGVVAGDSNPYVKEEIAEDALPEKTEEAAEPQATDVPKKKKRDKKSHLAFSTATELSARNLISKKVRTSLTAFAGSIGIIGIVLVLAFTSGVNAYISNLERSALSIYPLTVTRSNTSEIMSMASEFLKSMNNQEREQYPEGDTIYTNSVLGNFNTQIGTLATPNDLHSFKAYLDENFDESLGYIKYSYGVSLNVYCPDPDDKTDTMHPTEDTLEFMKVEPFTDVMESILGSENTLLLQAADYVSSWAELPDSNEALTAQYELVGENSKWPSKEIKYETDENGKKVAVTDVILFVDDRNQLNDYSLFMLGLVPGKNFADIQKAMNDPHFAENHTYTVDDLLGKEYYILAGCDYFEKTDTPYPKDVNAGIPEEDYRYLWKQTSAKNKQAQFVIDNYSVKARVSAVVRPKKGSVVVSLPGAIGYDHSLVEHLVNYANDNEAVKQFLKVEQINPNNGAKQILNILNGQEYIDPDAGSEVYLTLTHDLGIADLSTPGMISIYANSFEAKDTILKMIDDYNASVSEEKQIKYTDLLATIMSFVNTMTTAISSVLIGFMSISLIVSSIMIAVIIYTSVLERRKEVGVLRSIGARKRDIVSIFMAESGILGLSSGLLGVFVAWIITLPVKAFLFKLVGIPNLAIVTWWHALTMTLVSLALSILAGVIPAFLGAKQDPAVALRTE